MKLKYMVSFLAFLTILGCGKFQKEVEIKKTDIQGLIDKKFPFDKNAVVVRLTLESPTVYFKEKNVGLKLNFSGNYMQKQIKGGLDFNGQLTFNDETKKFYLKDFEIVEISVDDANFSSKEKLKATVTKLLNNYLDTYPVYTLDTTDMKQNVAGLLLKEIRVEGESLFVTLGV